MSDPYLYPGSGVLRNKLDIRDRHHLDRAERALVWERLREGAPPGDFDLAHLRAIHRHLFQDIYDWAGKLRTVELNKGGDQFLPRANIGMGMADVQRQLVAADYLRGRDSDQFAEGAACIIGDVNHVHPFREGNGRTQLEYLDQLAAQAGHIFDASRLNPGRWAAASREAHHGRYESMATEIRRALIGREPE